jgi:hypothetical protein
MQKNVGGCHNNTYGTARSGFRRAELHDIQSYHHNSETVKRYCNSVAPCFESTQAQEDKPSPMIPPFSPQTEIQPLLRSSYKRTSSQSKPCLKLGD